MAKLNQLFGTYHLDGSKLTRPGLPGHLQVGHRQRTTATKPPLFLVYKVDDRELYISSMYALSDAPEAYKIEYGGIRGVLEYQSHATVTIRPWIKTVCPNINYKPSQRL